MARPTFKITGLDALTKGLGRIEKQVRHGTAVAITKTAKAVEVELKREMVSQFDRPTPYTLKSTFTKPATRSRMVSFVGMKDHAFTKNRLSSAQMLGHHFSGGIRASKALETHLRRVGLLGVRSFVAPGAGARLDRFGNMSRGQIQQILSQLKAGPDPRASKANSRRSQRSVKRAGRIFWARGNARDGHLKRGAWVDLGAPIGLRPVLPVIAPPQYRRRFNLPVIASKTIAATWQKNLRAALIDAFNSAK